MKVLTFLVFFTVCYLIYKYIYDGTVSVKSNLDNNYYNVRNGPDKQLKADLLALIYLKLKLLVKTLSNDPVYNSSVPVKRLINNWESVTIKEIGNMEGDAAYVINKKNMSFCLQKSSNNVNLAELNLMGYVAIHELAHVMSNEVGHGAEFVKNFEFLLDYSKEINYYDPLLQRELPLFIPLKELETKESYCGVSLKNSIT